MAKKTPKKPSKEPKALVAKPLKNKSEGASLPSVADPVLSTYIKEIQKYPLLSREEEHALAVDYFENKTKESLQKLVTHNLRFVVKVAYEYVHYRLKLLDLIQEGNVGLLKAVQDFNPYKDVRLTTYAVWWIRSYIQDYLLKNYSLVKMGTTQAQKRLFYRLRKEQKELEKMGMRPNDMKLLASRLDVKEKEVEEMDQRLAGADFSLNAPMDSSDGKQDHMSMLSDPHEAADEEMGDAEQKELFKIILDQFAKTLEGRDKIIFEKRLISEDPMTLLEIGEKYGVTKERARQLEEQIKARLKTYVAEHYPDFNLLTGL